MTEQSQKRQKKSAKGANKIKNGMDLKSLYLLASRLALRVIVQGFEIHVQKLESRILVFDGTGAEPFQHFFLLQAAGNPTSCQQPFQCYL